MSQMSPVGASRALDTCEADSMTRLSVSQHSRATHTMCLCLRINGGEDVCDFVLTLHMSILSGRSQISVPWATKLRVIMIPGDDHVLLSSI